MLIAFLILIILAVIYISFVLPRLIDSPDMTPFNVDYAHRGLYNNNEGLPENSLGAFQAAIDNRYGIELDIQLSKDKIPMVFHDATLKRVCGIDAKLSDFTAEELQNIKLLDTEYTIPTLKEVLELVDGRIPLLVEFKPSNTELCDIACPILDEYNGIFCVESFDPRCIYWLRKHRPDIIRGQLTENYCASPTSKLPWLIKMILRHQVLNFLTRPDFVAYKFADRKTISNTICRKLWRAQGVTWTLKTLEEYETAVNEEWIPIFEDFLP